MPHVISLAGVLYALWLLLSGYLHEPLLLGLGILSVCAVIFIAHRMDVVDREGHPIHLSHRAIAYLPWLLAEIVKSNIAVAKVILRPRMPLSISVMTTPGSQRSDLGLTIYANSITLTPGTVTLGIEEGVLSVHALTSEAAEGVASGDMDRRVARLED